MACGVGYVQIGEDWEPLKDVGVPAILCDLPKNHPAYEDDPLYHHGLDSSGDNVRWMANREGLHPWTAAKRAFEAIDEHMVGIFDGDAMRLADDLKQSIREAFAIPAGVEPKR